MPEQEVQEQLYVSLKITSGTRAKIRIGHRLTRNFPTSVSRDRERASHSRHVTLTVGRKGIDAGFSHSYKEEAPVRKLLNGWPETDRRHSR